MEENFLTTTYNPNEFPRKAMMKITAYAIIIVVLNSKEGLDGSPGGTFGVDTLELLFILKEMFRGFQTDVVFF